MVFKTEENPKRRRKHRRNGRKSRRGGRRSWRSFVRSHKGLMKRLGLKRGIRKISAMWKRIRG